MRRSESSHPSVLFLFPLHSTTPDERSTRTTGTSQVTHSCDLQYQHGRRSSLSRRWHDHECVAPTSPRRLCWFVLPILPSIISITNNVSTPDPEARCPITNAKVEHHDTIVNHPSEGVSVPEGDAQAMDASACPALKGANNKDSITDATCPVVGPVNAHLPPTHPALNEKDAGAICPVTNAKLEHHKGKVATHPKVANDAPAGKCPVAGAAA